MEGFKQLCVWPGIIVEDDDTNSKADFTDWMFKKFGVKIIYESEQKTNSDPGNSESGGRNDLFFYIHDDDVAKFAVPRLQMGIRWWEDIFFNNQQYLYSDAFIAAHPRT